MKSWQQRERARDTLRKEVGYVRKPHGDRLRVALAFPEHLLGRDVEPRLPDGLPAVQRRSDDIVCERVFLPPKQELAELLASKTPLVTLESQTPVGDFDVIAFSVSFEWDYTNVLTLLRLAGVPLRAAERDDRASAGRDRRRRDVRQPRAAGAVRRRDRRRRRRGAGAGAAARVPRGRRIARDLLRRLAQRARLLRPVVLRRRSTRPTARSTGFVPRAGTGAPLPCGRRRVKTTDALDPPATSIFTPDTEFGSRFLVEVVRGCANLCRFCWAGYNYLPVRAFPTRSHPRARAKRRARTRDRVGLVSIALCDHPDIERILAQPARDGLLRSARPRCGSTT